MREAIWETADELYPTFMKLLAKVNLMVQDDVDSRQGIGSMDVDNVDDDNDADWEDTGQTLSGKGPDGEDTLLVLQRRGSAMRVVPKGRGKGARKGAAPWKKTPPSSDKGKGDKWDKNGCARCGRSSHWAK